MASIRIGAHLTTLTTTTISPAVLQAGQATPSRVVSFPLAMVRTLQDLFESHLDFVAYMVLKQPTAGYHDFLQWRY